MTSQIHSSLLDHAKTILQDAPISQGDKAMIWDAWHDARTVSNLARKLTELDVDIPQDVQEALLAAKKISVSAPDAMDKVLNTISRMDPNTLALAESHPAVLHVLADAMKG